MDLYQLVGALRHCGRTRSSRLGKSLHSHMLKLGFSSEVYVGNNVMAMYVDFASVGEARKLFDELPERNVVSWATMISAYTGSGSPHSAIGLYTHMMEAQSQEPNGFLYSAVLKACGLVGDLELGRVIHERVTRAKLMLDTVLMNSLLDMYVKCGCFGDARKLFAELVAINSTSWNTMISGHCKEGHMEEALKLFRQMPKPDSASWNSIIAGFASKGSALALEYLCMMHREGLKLDGFTLPCALKVCGSLGLVDIGKQIHCYFIKSPLKSCCFTVTALLDMYSSCFELEEAVKLFLQFSSSKYSNSLELWNSMLSAYAANGDGASAMKLLTQIHSSGLALNSYTFGSALRICMTLQDLKLWLQVHGVVVTSGFELDYVVGSILIDFYVKHGYMKGALALFHKLPEKDIVVWSSLIAGCVIKGLDYFAFTLLRNMITLGADVDQFILSSVLKACSNLVALGSGKQLHTLSIKKGYILEEVVLTSLVNMYCKCGEIDDGLTLFSSSVIRDVTCWTGIIVGCGQNGRAREAIRLFQEMMKSRLKPNGITFSAVLSACRHTGLVEEARTIFNSMKTEHRIDPQLEHYYCMVDLLGQAGCFSEVVKLIADMPFDPDQTVWSSLLVACGTHRNTELLRFIHAKLLEDSCKESSIYVTLSNVYATLEMWDYTAEVRETIKRLDMRDAGKSWIQTT